MFALILPPFQHQRPASAAKSLDFPSEKACNDAATKRSMETLNTSGGASACLTTMRLAQ